MLVDDHQHPKRTANLLAQDAGQAFHLHRQRLDTGDSKRGAIHPISSPSRLWPLLVGVNPLPGPFSDDELISGNNRTPCSDQLLVKGRRSAELPFVEFYLLTQIISQARKVIRAAVSSRSLPNNRLTTPYPPAVLIARRNGPAYGKCKKIPG